MTSQSQGDEMVSLEHPIEGASEDLSFASRPFFLQQAFEAQVAQTPLAPALYFEGQTLSYQVLNEQANQLAAFLQKRGVGPEILIGVYLHRSQRLAVVLLAILKAGGAFVPFDPTYPQERLRYMVEDAQIALLLTQSALVEHASTFCSREIVNLEDWTEEIRHEPVANLTLPASLHHLAYLMYTSGSTGRPKGILISHAAASHFFSELQAAYGLEASESVLLKAPLNFDASLCEFFWPLCVGARLVMARPDGQKDPLYLAELIQQQQITTVLFVPSMLQVFIEAAPRSQCQSLRRVIAGGETLSPTLQSAFFAWAGAQQIELTNTYGPTETVVFMTSWLCQNDPQEAQRSIPLGQPLANVPAYILDSSLQCVPVGEVGELYIGGSSLARGYSGRPDLTAERFLPDPLSVVCGARMYRTGDLASQLPTGELLYLGRSDNQVKIRGNRIELEEIEQCLLEQSALKQAVVLVRENQLGDKHLVAYLVARPHAVLATSTSSSSSRYELWPSIGEYEVYDELIYYGLTGDEPRNRAYKAAFEQVVKGKVVIDIGTGRDALLARLCLEAGARQVYAVEKLPAAYEHAQELVRQLGLQDRIAVIHGDITTVDLPQAAEVAVSEIFEAIAGAEGAAVLLNSVQRHLVSGAVTVPARCWTYIAAASLPEDLVPAFTPVSAYYVEKIFNEVGHPFDLRLCIKNFPAANLLSTRGIFEEIDCSGQAQTEFQHTLNLTITRRGLMHGFILWLVLELAPGHTLDILEGEYSWFPVYFPLFDPGIELEAGDLLEVCCHGSLSDDRVHLDYAIEGQIVTGRGVRLPFSFASSHHQPIYQQNAFYQRLFGNGIPTLAAPKGQEKELLEEVRAVLSKRLPEYMVPSSFVLMDELPINASGKIDRQALLAREEVNGKKVGALPETPTQKALAEIWEELLGGGPVGLHDNFFLRGGHSLLVMRLATKIRERFQSEIPLQSLFEVSELEEQARLIERRIA